MRGKLVFTTFVVLVLYLAGVSRADMVAYWDFEGDFADAIGGNDATPIGDTTVILDPGGTGTVYFDGIRLVR